MQHLEPTTISRRATPRLTLALGASIVLGGAHALVSCASGNSEELSSGPAASAAVGSMHAASSSSSSASAGGASSSAGTGGQGGAGGAGGQGGASMSSSSASSAAGGATGSGGSGGAATGTVLLLAGGGAKVLGGEYHPATGWSATMLADATNDGPSIALTGAGSAVGLIRSTSNAGELRYTTWTPGVWTNFAQVMAGVTTRAAPSAGNNAGGFDVVFQGDDFKHYWGVFANNVWNPGNGMVGTNPQAFGPAPAALAVVAGVDVIAYAGNDHDLYDQTRGGNGWSAGNPHGLGDYTQTTPAIVAMNGGVADLLIVAIKNDGTLAYTARKNASWSAPAALAANDPNAASNNPVALAPLAGGKAVGAWRKPNGDLFYSLYDPMAGWTVPAAAFNPSFATPSSPALAVGVGGFDAEIAFADAASGQVFHARLSNGSFGVPAVVGGNGMTTVALTSAP